MKYFSMFSGIGGFELGIQQAYVDISTRERNEQGRVEISTNDAMPKPKQMAIQPLCIGYSEIDKYAIEIYNKHFKHKNYGNATTINAEELPDFDLLVGGFPCQSFSIAGKRGGLNDARGTLFYDIARIAQAKKPQHLLLENVKGLLSHDDGNTFKLIISTFTELGYDLEWQVLNSKNFGVPQNRERVFIIGHLGRCCGRQIFPLRSANKTAVELSRPVSNTLTTRYEGGTAVGTYVAESELNAQKINVVGTLDEGTWAKRNESIRRVYGTDGLAPTIPTGTGGGVMPKIQIPKDAKIRRLTPTECERLQGFPDGWTKFGKPILVEYDENDIVDISDTQRYKCLGNGVTVNVIKEIITKMYANEN